MLYCTVTVWKKGDVLYDCEKFLKENYRADGKILVTKEKNIQSFLKGCD